MVGLGRFELPTHGLGNRCSIHLSYRPAWLDLIYDTNFTRGALRTKVDGLQGEPEFGRLVKAFREAKLVASPERVIENCTPHNADLAFTS